MILLEDKECAGCLNIGKAACTLFCARTAVCPVVQHVSIGTAHFLQDALCVFIALCC